MEILASTGREILEITTSRENAIAQEMAGLRGGGHLRGEIARLLPREHEDATPLHLLLDDFSGASLVSGWAWLPRAAASTEPRPAGAPRPRRMEGICSGFRPGSSALEGDGTPRIGLINATRVPPLPNPEDPLGWHRLAEQEGVGMRRARRIDVWADALVHIDVAFQDSATAPDGGPRIAIHEYAVQATADPKTFELLSLEVQPRVLPFPECPDASPNAQRMVGERLADFRLRAPEILAGTLGCTHLNDVLRSMQDVPRLAMRLHG